MHSHIDGKGREQDVLTVALGSFMKSFYMWGEAGRNVHEQNSEVDDGLRGASNLKVFS